MSFFPLPVVEHKEWWSAAWNGDRSRPELLFNGVAIRKNSKDLYRFDS